MAHSGFLAVGPRQLPQGGTVQVRVDAGSGAIGQRVAVPVKDLHLAEMDSGRGSSALYVVQTESEDM
ncbi:hypothetical protein ACN27F_27960 [Solwaraspora sp. WMMB335]|uniref:hypothetical protein n=1 Tax=Solwaraspora sp. WMMB335 TaxID=3404118 RepID=UPI003B930D18